MVQSEKSIALAEFTEQNGDFLTVSDITRLLKVSRPIVDRMLKTGKLPGAKLGGSYRVRSDDFIKWWDREVRQEQKNIIKGCP